MRADKVHHTLHCGIDRFGRQDERDTDHQQSPVRRRDAEPLPQQDDGNCRCRVNAAMRLTQKHDNAPARMAEGIKTLAKPAHHGIKSA